MRSQVEAIKPEQLDQEQCWNAVVARDAQADGTFVFAVRSTGIYCRPSCPARRPGRAQVVFFHRPEEALTAGFRPCLRCEPDQALSAHAQTELIEQICRYIEEHLEASLRLADLSQQFHLSSYHLQRTFKRIMGISPRQYVESCRLGLFKARLQDGEAVTSALYSAGYQSSSRVYDRAPTQLGMTPTTYQQRGKGARIGYTIVESPLGYVLVAATERGIAAVRLGDSEQLLEADLVHEYPEAQMIRDDERLCAWVTVLLQSLQGQIPQPSVPFDIQATAFQWKVWEQLRAIPLGQTRSYGEIARSIGQPAAARAVARACATNPVAIFIPCHRVVRENGELGGYRWGLERKRLLLDLEHKHSQR